MRAVALHEPPHVSGVADIQGVKSFLHVFLHCHVGEVVQLRARVRLRPLHEDVAAVVLLPLVHDPHGTEDFVNYPIAHESFPCFVCAEEDILLASYRKATHTYHSRFIIKR
jgi:hypothetical protein